MERYNPFSIEEKWQKKWLDEATFHVTEQKDKPKYYVLEMLPYPSGNLHMGHVRNYTIGDVLARFKKAQGFNVLHPMGWDAFGLPAENAALQRKMHPDIWTRKNIAYMKESMQRFGWSYDWAREFATCDETYYGHQQALFIDLYEKGLVYQKESLVNWDPVDHTVLANEQVIDGKGWRSGASVERRSMTQWFLKITQYAQELLEDLSQLEGWPDRVKTMQENWIGRSEGLKFSFKVTGFTPGLEVYTTRPDTLMGVTFCAVAPEHPLAVLATETDDKAVSFIEDCQSTGTALEDIEKAEKKAYKTTFLATHPISGEELPVYIANYVLMGYGTGAVMAVPGHDERDYLVAQKYDLPVKQVIQGVDSLEDKFYTGPGILINSGEFDGLESEKAKQAIIDKIESLGVGEKTINYRLRDWGISRQRYWGAPIPFVHCDGCGIVPVPKEQLPVILPQDVTFGQPGNPLEHHPTWKDTSCPSCGAQARRETDTMDTFMDSSWYFLRYCCAEDTESALDRSRVDYWMAVDQYIGGIEHAVLHLLYARFLTKVFKGLSLVSANEPFKSLLCQGMVLNNSYQTENGQYINPQQVTLHTNGEAVHKETGEALKVNRMEKVSKSKNNGIDPYVLMERYGADTLRLFMMFAAPPERDLEWSETGVEGAWRFLGRLWALIHEAPFDLAETPVKVKQEQLQQKHDKELNRAIHKTIRKVTMDIERFQFNTMISAVMELSNLLGDMRQKWSSYKENDVTKMLYKQGVSTCVQLLNPTVPHMTEELWQKIGHNTPLTQMSWPAFDAEAAADEEITLVVQVNGKLKERLTVTADLSDEEAEKLALNAVKEQLEGLTVRKCVIVPKRLVNVVAS